MPIVGKDVANQDLGAFDHGTAMKISRRARIYDHLPDHFLLPPRCNFELDFPPFSFIL